MKRFIVMRNNRGLTSEHKTPECRDGIRALDVRVRHGGIRVRLRRPQLRALCALARSLENAHAFSQSRDPNGFESPARTRKSPNAVMASGRWM